MNKIFCLAILLSIFLGKVAISAADESQLSESRNAAKTLGNQLKSELMTAIKAGGHLNAISVCSQRAPLIAERISRENDLKIRRTSLRFRNSINAPDSWEEQALQLFQAWKEKGQDVKTMEYSEVISQGEGQVFRYMKAIPVVEPCLACHGTQVNADIKAKLVDLYPKDNSTGFSVGDIIGAISIIKD